MNYILGGNIVSQGEKITVSNGVLNVPNNPIIPFIEGDGTGPDIWNAASKVLEAAVEKAYKGEKKSHGKKFMPVKRLIIKQVSGFLPKRWKTSESTSSPSKVL